LIADGPLYVTLSPSDQTYTREERSNIDVTCDAHCWVCTYSWTGPYSWTTATHYTPRKSTSWPLYMLSDQH